MCTHKFLVGLAVGLYNFGNTCRSGYLYAKLSVTISSSAALLLTAIHHYKSDKSFTVLLYYYTTE